MSSDAALSPTTDLDRSPFEIIHDDLDDPANHAKWSAIFSRDRDTTAYRSVFMENEPLVSVCITTSDRAEVLAERALASVQRQHYQRLQVIIAGDMCEDDTEATVRSFNDKRFSFINLPQRGPYPRPRATRRLVAGTYPGNAALAEAKGHLITHIDEDDTFAPQRIETLVTALKREEADLVFHPFYWENEDQSWKTVGDGNFRHGHTGTSMVLYHNWFRRLSWDVFAYRLSEPGDWNRFRKIKSLGARLHYVDQLLTWHWKYPLRPGFKAKPGEEFLD